MIIIVPRSDKILYIVLGIVIVILMGVVLMKPAADKLSADDSSLKLVIDEMPDVDTLPEEVIEIPDEVPAEEETAPVIIEEEPAVEKPAPGPSISGKSVYFLARDLNIEYLTQQTAKITDAKFIIQNNDDALDGIIKVYAYDDSTRYFRTQKPMKEISVKLSPNEKKVLTPELNLYFSDFDKEKTILFRLVDSEGNMIAEQEEKRMFSYPAEMSLITISVTNYTLYYAVRDNPTIDYLKLKIDNKQSEFNGVIELYYKGDGNIVDTNFISKDRLDMKISKGINDVEIKVNAMIDPLPQELVIVLKDQKKYDIMATTDLNIG